MVPGGEELAALRRLAVEPALRQQPVEEDERRVDEREPVGPEPERQRARAEDRDGERGREQHVLPGGDDVERGAADAGVPELRHDEVVEREPDDEDRRARCRGRRARSCDRHEREAEVDDPDRPREEAAQVAGCRAGGSPAPSSCRRGRRRGRRRARAASGRAAAACAPRSGTSGSASSGTRGGRRAAPRPRRAAAARASPTCSITAFEKTTSNAGRRTAARTRRPATYAISGIAAPEAGAVVEAERRDPAGPRVELLEEVVRAAARLAAVAAEADLVDADVEHGRRRRRPHLVEEEPQLPPARAERDGVDELHPGEGTGPSGAPPRAR